MSHAAPAVRRELFGTLADGTAIERIALRSAAGFEARVITFGARLQGLFVPDGDGRCDDVVLGFDDLDGYLAPRQFYGATVGRYANRIAGASFTLDGQVVRLAANDGPNALHGGLEGFDRKPWRVVGLDEGPQPALTLAYVSADGEEGYPGTLEVLLTYRLTGAAELSLRFEASCDRPTVVNLTNHSFFNLDGAVASGDILDHRLTVAAPSFLAVGPGSIPLPGGPHPVEHTPFDFRQPVAVGARIRSNDAQLRQGRGYDHNFCLGPGDGLRLAARLESPNSRRVLELLTDQPGLQVYSGNFLDGGTAGKAGRLHRQSDAICLEPQIWPDAPNRPDFPSARLAPGEVYRHHSVYRFSLA